MSDTMTPIPVPAAVADNIAAAIQQQQQIGAVLQATVTTAAQVLGVPEYWRYDPATRAFVPPTQGASDGPA